MVGYLKFVKDGGQEIEILQYLAGLPSESNHTVRPNRIWPITDRSIIADRGQSYHFLYRPRYTPMATHETAVRSCQVHA